MAQMLSSNLYLCNAEYATTNIAVSSFLAFFYAPKGVCFFYIKKGVYLEANKYFLYMRSFHRKIRIIHSIGLFKAR